MPTDRCCYHSRTDATTTTTTANATLLPLLVQMHTFSGVGHYASVVNAREPTRPGLTTEPRSQRRHASRGAGDPQVAPPPTQLQPQPSRPQAESRLASYILRLHALISRLEHTSMFFQVECIAFCQKVISLSSYTLSHLLIVNKYLSSRNLAKLEALRTRRGN